MTTGGGTILLCAGGTGGHLFPAEALANVLAGRGWRVELATDHRAAGYGAEFPAAAIHIVPSGTVTGSSLLGRVGGAARLALGAWRSRGLIRRVRPAAVVGFGGYPTVPPVLAATLLKVPTIIHDQNAVLGRANRFLAPRVTRIATGSRSIRLADDLAAKAVHTGVPVRPAVVAAARAVYEPPGRTGPFHLLVFGGSQGAEFLSRTVPAAVALLPEAERARLAIVQQCREDDLPGVRQVYDDLGIGAELATFFNDLPARIAASQLVVSRSGASTVGELAVIGRPAILVPLPGAIDQDQRANAELLSAAGAGWSFVQSELTVERLSGFILDLMRSPAKLVAAAAAARRVGEASGAEQLADLVESIARPRDR